MSDEINGGRLRSFVARIERLEEEIAELNGDKAEVFAEAKGEGWNVKAIKALIAERRKRAKDPNGFLELETEIELYRAALGEPSRVHAHEEMRETLLAPRVVELAAKIAGAAAAGDLDAKAVMAAAKAGRDAMVATIGAIHQRHNAEPEAAE